MRIIVIAVTALLALSGLGVRFEQTLGIGAGGLKALSLVHIWGGVFYLVIFSLYGWDHISAHRKLLLSTRTVTLTGATQTLAAVVIMLTGIVLLLYGNAAWPTLHLIHYWLTYPLLAAIALHFLSPKP